MANHQSSINSYTVLSLKELPSLFPIYEGLFKVPFLRAFIRNYVKYTFDENGRNTNKT